MGEEVATPLSFIYDPSCSAYYHSDNNIEDDFGFHVTLEWEIR